MPAHLLPGRCRPAAGPRGLSLPALMVGLALGLMVGGAVLHLVLLHGRSQARALLEARLLQESRAMLGLLGRELRRARSPQDGGPAWTLGAELHYHAGTGSGTVPRAWRLRDGSLQWQLAPGGGFQALNDPSVLRVRRFELLAEGPALPLGPFCPDACGPDEPDCPQLIQPVLRITLETESSRPPALRVRQQARVWPRAPRQAPGPCPAPRP